MKYTTFSILFMICSSYIIYGQTPSVKKKGISIIGTPSKQGVVPFKLSPQSLKRTLNTYLIAKIDYNVAGVDKISKPYTFSCDIPQLAKYIQISLSKVGEKKSMIEVGIPRNPKLTDVLYAIRVIEMNLKHSIRTRLYVAPFAPLPHQQLVNMNKGKLKDKILLIDKAILHEKVKADQIKKFYPYAYQIVDYSKIKAAILSKDKKYAYIQYSPYLSLMKGEGLDLTAYIPLMATYVVSIEDGALLGVSRVDHAHNPKCKIKKKHLVRYIAH